MATGPNCAAPPGQTTLQEAIEAPRVRTEGTQLEPGKGFPDMLGLKAALEAFEHPVTVVEKVAGGMNGVLADEEGWLHGAACSCSIRMRCPRYDRRALAWLANQNCITPHVWTSRAPRLYQPDLCVFDLDPSADEPLALQWAVLAQLSPYQT